MSFNKNIKDQGFTIVELLIVIVVIGILAAITIVAYNGIQNRGKAAAGQALATQIDNKAESYNAVKGVYPDLATLKAVTTDPAEAKLDKPDVVVAAGATAGSEIAATTAGVGTATALTAGNGQVVAYKFCSTSLGGVVYYWDASVPGIKSIKSGTGC